VAASALRQGKLVGVRELLPHLPSSSTCRWRNARSPQVGGPPRPVRARARVPLLTEFLTDLFLSAVVMWFMACYRV
jgi:hypothetical protein